MTDDERVLVSVVHSARVGMVRLAGEMRLAIQVSPESKLVAKSVPGALWYSPRGYWHCPATPVHCKAIDRLFDEVVWSEAAAALHAVNTVKVDDDELPDLPTRTTGWKHQRRVFHYARQLRASGIFISMGGGKSAVVIGLAEEWQSRLVVVLCPKSVMGVWPKQFDIHGLSDWECFVAAGAGTVHRKAQAGLAWYLRPTRSADGTPKKKVIIVNYDASWRPGMAEMVLSLAGKDVLLVCDESHKIKAPGGKASRYASKLGKKCGHVLLLTGTPMPYGFQDIYAQMRAAEPGVFGTSFARFKAKYAEVRKINDKVDKIVGFRDERAKAEFIDRLDSVSITIGRDDMDLDVPGALRPVERSVALSRESFSVYQELKNELIAELDVGTVTADNALTKLLRLRQVTSGHVRTEDGAVVTLGSEKAGLLADTLEDLLPHDRPIVVFGVFHHDLDCIAGVADNLGLRYGELSGRRRDGLAGDSTIADGLDLVGVQMQSGGVGVDFTKACIAIYYSIDFNLGNVEQSFARLDRPGQTTPVTFIHLVTTTPLGGITVDGITYKALGERKALNEAVITALKEKKL